MASVKEKEKNVELKPLRNIVKLRTYHSIHTGNVDVLVHIKGLDSSTFPSQVEQITTNVPDLDITDQRGRLGTITLVASVDAFQNALHIFEGVSRCWQNTFFSGSGITR